MAGTEIAIAAETDADEVLAVAAGAGVEADDGAEAADGVTEDGTWDFTDAEEEEAAGAVAVEALATGPAVEVAVVSDATITGEVVAAAAAVVAVTATAVFEVVEASGAGLDTVAGWERGAADDPLGAGAARDTTAEGNGVFVVVVATVAAATAADTTLDDLLGDGLDEAALLV